MAAGDTSVPPNTTPPPTFRTISFNALCRKVDPEMDIWQPVYRMSSGRTYLDTDRTSNGFYRP